MMKRDGGRYLRRPDNCSGHAQNRAEKFACCEVAAGLYVISRPAETAADIRAPSPQP